MTTFKTTLSPQALERLGRFVLELLTEEALPDKRAALRTRVHAACLEMALTDPLASINSDFFDRVGELPTVCRSRAVVSGLYYEAIKSGGQTIQQARASAGMLTKNRER